MTGEAAFAPRTPLARLIAAEIVRDGPMTVARYMARCLADPEHGYYRHATAIGSDGDFITAPEISQVFGEIIGLWAAVVWQQMGAPERVRLIEAGPGRGTMMRDMLRAAQLVPAFRSAADVVLVEGHPQLRATQMRTLGDAGLEVRHLAALDRMAELEQLPTILVANEFLDALPAEQAVLTEEGWRLRVVALDPDGALTFGSGEAIGLPPWFRALKARVGDIVTLTDAGPLIGSLQGVPMLAALLIDYGQESARIGDTLQAVRAHAFEHPLASPGVADLSAAVDFTTVARAAREHNGLAVDGPVTQAEFLGALGIVERTSRLMAADPAQAATLEAALARLIFPGGMGGRFKVVGLRSPALSALPGLTRLSV